jgi:methylmalonyl-CoA/ethylmalonyl-CoA epimerase
MIFRGVHHIGIAVRDLEKAVSRWASLLGARSGPTEENAARGVRLAEVCLEGGPLLEFVSPLGEGSPVSRFLEARGEGIHHFALDVDDIDAAMAELRKGGLELVSDEPVPGAGGSRIAFVHPRSLNGVLLELRQAPKNGTR